MSVANGIHFRYLASQLTEQEIQTFISSLNEDLVINALFYYVVYQSKADSFIEPAYDVTQTVSNIIQSRKPAETETKGIKLDQLPQRLIGNVASYLKGTSYEALSQCTRAIYLGCNTPNLLQSLSVNSENQVIKDKITKMPRYPFAKHIRLDVEKISMKRARAFGDTLRKMQRIRSLTIVMRATSPSQRAFEAISLPSAGEAFPAQIEFLDVTVHNAVQYRFVPDRFAYALIFLLRFRNIKYLSLTMRQDRRDQEEYDQKHLDQIECTCTNLLGLRVDGNHGMDAIGETVLLTNHKSLRYLSIGVWRGYPTDSALFNFLTFPALKELHINGNDVIPIALFAERASSKNLEKMSLDFYCGVANESTTDPEAMENIIEKVMKKYLKLNVLKIVFRFDDPGDEYYYDRNWAQGHQPMTPAVCKGIERGLMETQDLLRDTFKIWIETTLLNQEERVQFMQNLTGMMTALVNCNITDFMVILRIYGTVDAAEQKKYEYLDVIPAIEKEELESLYSISDNIVIHKISPTPCQKWVVTNKGCRMNGYSEQWMMSRHDPWTSE